MSSPLVSMVTAGYNAGKYLLDAVHSVLNQTYANIEYIYVDDGSNDGSIELLKGNVQDQRLTIIKNANNIGPFRSLNKGIEVARGRYIAILDADDVCMPFRIERQVTALEQNANANVSGTGFEIINEEGILQNVRELNYSDSECRYRMQFNNIVAHSSVMYRADAIDRKLCYSTKYGISEDYEMLLKVLRLSDIAVIAMPCIQYRISEHGMTRTRKKEMDRIQYKIAEEHYSIYHNIEITENMYVNAISKPTSIKYLMEMYRIRRKVYSSINRRTMTSIPRYICYKNQMENTQRIARCSLMKLKADIMKREL